MYKVLILTPQIIMKNHFAIHMHYSVYSAF